MRIAISGFKQKRTFRNCQNDLEMVLYSALIWAFASGSRRYDVGFFSFELPEIPGRIITERQVQFARQAKRIPLFH